MHISQMDFVNALITEATRQGMADVNVRQLNAIVSAADLVVDALAKPHTPATPGMGLNAWLECDDRGTSSNSIALNLALLIHRRAPIVPWNARTQHPLDPDDFGRCVRLLDAEPLLRPHMPKMAKVSRQWAAIIAVWDELEALYREESPSGQAPKLYQRMQELLNTPTGASSHASK